MTRIILALMAVVWLWGSPAGVEAAKKRVWTTTKTATKSSGTGTPSVGASRKWDNYYFTFYNVGACESVAYELTFMGNGLEQGVAGAVKPSEGNTVRRTLYLGTCSKKVCTPYRGISSVRLGVTYKLKNGTVLAKRYKVKY